MTQSMATMGERDERKSALGSTMPSGIKETPPTTGEKGRERNRLIAASAPRAR
jgi:hypothetical protein